MHNKPTSHGKMPHDTSLVPSCSVPSPQLTLLSLSLSPSFLPSFFLSFLLTGVIVVGGVAGTVGGTEDVRVPAHMRRRRKSCGVEELRARRPAGHGARHRKRDAARRGAALRSRGWHAAD